MIFTYRARLAGLSAMLLCSIGAQAQTTPEETEVWRPEPARVTPATATATHAPSDAVLLFDGANLNEWVSTAAPDKPAPWTVANGVFTVRPGSGNIQTRREFGDYQLHVEWRIPPDIKGTGQDRGNSGLFLASTGANDRGYELQILDCVNNKTYVNSRSRW
jgi:hypothetical protein